MHKEFMESIGWHVVGKPGLPAQAGTHLFFRRLGPVAIAKIQRPQTIDIPWLNQMRKKYHILTLYIEPGLQSKINNPFGLQVEPFAHSATSLVDLALSESALLASFSQKTRYNIVHTLKQKELTLTNTRFDKLSSQQISDFFTLDSAWSKQSHVVGHGVAHLQAVLHSYASAGDLHLCYRGSTLVGSLMILYSDHVATYYTAHALPQGYTSYAPTLLTWQAMLRAKANKCDIFDFGGIFDPRYPKLYKNWQGFTKFKSGFRPTVVSYPPTYLKLFW
jgi:lipid II:glycine glycyltransferase (peptidoglycan interpeptide bridge formation enzyme)